MASTTTSNLSSAINAALAPAPNRIGVIVCSQRSPRAGLQITQFVLDTLKTYQKAHPSATPYELSLIDLNDHPLPLYNEPGIPSRIHSSSEYKYEHTRKWSDFISSYQAIVFVTPQYNWGYPASIKNAIDYLFNEWKGKPALVVSYGGHGGGKAAVQLQQVLQGVDMKVVKETVGLTFPDRAALVKAATGQDLGLKVSIAEESEVIDKENALETLSDAKDDGEGEGKSEALWAKESKEICTAFWELISLLNE
ncbi:putative NADPH-dependent FMN reductase [Exophiala viscosa]|uniref:NADPH-dependent FMN reductase n=1 Tax=Exophiala viscosa TaxID=2486360 RepID=A0AAN6DNK2_9EURO|nr:putative NADPH-dependent FMN reductase [Exophiala viscosa]